jgi:tetratricopeptide (TPR) repeat protein
MSPEAADALRRQHFSSLRRAIAACGGTEVKNLGDGLMVAFSTASAALSCAVGMQQGVDLDSRRADRPLGLRVGVSGGEVTKEGEDYFGDPVIEAARLCARAEGGQILASDVVRAMAGRRSTLQFRAQGAIPLKGLPEPVEVIDVGWEPLDELEFATDVIPLQTRLAYEPWPGVIGRELEVTFLTDALKRATAGGGRQVVLISGEAGLGKTTLAASAARQAADAGAFALLGRCDEDVASPYRPFVEALTHYVANAAEGVLRSHVRDYGPELARLIPALRRRLGDLPPAQTGDADAERYLFFRSVVGLLAEASALQPLVLVLDDLQWADRQTLQLLRHLVGSDALGRVLVVATYRDSELSASHPLVEALTSLRREPEVHRIELKGLDDTGVMAFMEAAAGHGLDEAARELAHALSRETDGNPFFVGEVLRHLSETGSISRDQTGRWTSGDLDAIVLPDSVRQVVSSRVARLGDRACRVLSYAAVIGRDFDIELLGKASQCGEDELLDILDRAAAAAVVREAPDAPGHFSFSHVLIQHTLYQDLGATRRARSHRQVAEALEVTCAGDPAERVGELARHWSSATKLVDPSKAISYSRQAGDAALAALAPEDAVRHFAQALQLTSQLRVPDPLLLTDLLLGLGIAQQQAGLPAFRATLLDAAHHAQDLGATDRLVRAALANNRGFQALGVVDTDRIEVIDAALAAISGSDSPERALLLATLCNELTYGPLERRQALADEAKAMARRLDDLATLVQVLYTVHLTALNLPAVHEERLRETPEALEMAEALGDPVHLYWAAADGHMTGLQAGDFEMAARCLATTKMLSQRLRQPTMMWTTCFHEAAVAQVVGNADLAEELATRALHIGNDSGQPDAFGFYGAQLIVIRWQQGRLGELIPLVLQVAAENPSLAGFHSALALAHLDGGDKEEAAHLLRVAAAKGFPLVHLDIAWLAAVVNYSLVAIYLDAIEVADGLIDLLAPYHALVAYQGVLGQEPVALCLGGLSSLLGRYEDAERYFAEAIELITRGEMKFAEAETLLLWGRMLVVRGQSGDSERAREMLIDAHEAGARRGYASIERRAALALSNLN